MAYRKNHSGLRGYHRIDEEGEAGGVHDLKINIVAAAQGTIILDDVGELIAELLDLFVPEADGDFPLQGVLLIEGLLEVVSIEGFFGVVPLAEGLGSILPGAEALLGGEEEIGELRGLLEVINLGGENEDEGDTLLKISRGLGIVASCSGSLFRTC